jgi:hypothetical protein
LHTDIAGWDVAHDPQGGGKCPPGGKGDQMKASNRPVTSREYKLMLNVDRFKDRGQGSQVFLNLLDFLVEKGGGEILERQNKEEERQTCYLDTAEFALRQHGFALRLREEATAADGFQLNLKYRGADRYLSAAQDLSSPAEGKTKFEEDVLPPFVSKFAHSTSINTGTMPDVDRMKHIVALFPGLRSLDIDGQTSVTIVNNFKAVEIVRKLCKLQFGGPPIIKASLSFWYLTKETKDWPLVGEFSFDYDILEDGADEDGLEMYPRQTVEGANYLFGAVQRQSGWSDLHTTTKTAFALEVL